MKGNCLVIPMDRLGVVSAQPDFTKAVAAVNALIREGRRVNWLTVQTKLETERFPEGFIFQPGGFVTDNVEDISARLQSDGVEHHAFEADYLPGRPLQKMPLAIYSGKGAAEFCTKPLCEALGWMGFDLEMLGDKEIRDGALDSFGALLVPGGPDAGEGYYYGLGERGYKNIREFMQDRGAYFGICAGAYLPLTDPKEKNRFWLGMVGATDEQGLDYWRTGTGFIRVKIDDNEHPFSFGLAAGPVSTQDMVYWEGPAMKPINKSVHVLATFQSFIASGAAGERPGWDLFDNGPAKDSINSWYNVLTKERFDRHLAGRAAMLETAINGHKVLLYSPHAEFGNIGVGPRKASQVFQFLSNGLFYLAVK